MTKGFRLSGNAFPCRQAARGSGDYHNVWIIGKALKTASRCGKPTVSWNDDSLRNFTGKPCHEVEREM
jgi:hypothetical protein